MLISKMQELSILFEPGTYFHHDFTYYIYNKLPDILKKIENHNIIVFYNLISPRQYDLPLPSTILNSWYTLSKAALLLGILISDIKKITIESPWIISYEDYDFICKLLHNNFTKFKLTYQSSYEIADFIALGAIQLKIFISLFSTSFSQRFVFIFSKKINKLMGKYNMDTLIIPDSFIERICLYAENKHN